MSALASTATKRCTKCGAVKAVEAFHRDRQKADGRHSHCKECIRAANRAYNEANRAKDRARWRAYYEKNKEKILASNQAWYEANRERWNATEYDRLLRKQYGLTRGEAESLLAAQDGRCATCRAEVTLGGTTQAAGCIDHDHQLGHVRGILCRRCNVVLGLLGDNVQTLQALADYLERMDSQELAS